MSTLWAYQQLEPPFPDATWYRERIDALRRGDLLLREFCRRLENTFQPIVEQRYPIIRELRERLLAAGAAAALMSGSGSAVFGVFEDADKAKGAAAHLKNWARNAQARGVIVREAESLYEGLH